MNTKFSLLKQFMTHGVVNICRKTKWNLHFNVQYDSNGLGLQKAFTYLVQMCVG